MFHEQLEVIHLLPFEEDSLNCALAILNANIDRSSLGVEEGDDGLENGPSSFIILEG
jgi:hypothetical protein